MQTLHLETVSTKNGVVILRDLPAREGDLLERIVTLADGRRVSAPLEWFPRLLRATPEQRDCRRLIGRGIGIHWEDVDEDISVRSLIAA